MKHVHYTKVENEPVDLEGAKGVSVRWVISDADGAKNFAMRVFEVEPDGRTPYHDHDWEHEVFILSGSGVVCAEGQDTSLIPGDVVFVPGGEKHNFQAGPEGLAFICLVPYQ
jgi:quercetin dioxygenase-like cupin family protein